MCRAEKAGEEMKQFAISVLVLFLSLFSISAHAEILGALGAGMQFEYAANGRTMEARTPISVRGGYGFSFGDTYLEYSRFSTTEGASFVGIDRIHNEWIVWYRRSLWQSWYVSPFIAGGMGAQVDEVHTRFQEETETGRGGPQTVFAGAFGMKGRITKNIDLQLEARVETSPNDAPNPELGAFALIGFSI
jgi:hypothetical protein